MNAGAVNRVSTVVLIEACVDSPSTAQAAVEAGAHRIELCGPGDGGTTPSPILVAECRRAVTVPLHVMIRPHDGGFVYHDGHLAEMIDSIQAARDLGADGVVFGILTRGCRIAESEVAHLAAASRPMATVFHRAFDRVPDAEAALDTLMSIGVNAVLTSGLSRTALEGATMLAALRERAESRLTVMAGGGVRPGNVRALVDACDVRAVHARGLDAEIIRGISKALNG